MMNSEELQTRINAIPYWYHTIELPGGIVTRGWAPICAEKYGIPDDMAGKRVLDIGAWDGYWTWEALKRGAAEVVAIDDFSDTCGQPIKRDGWTTFDICREAFGFTEELPLPIGQPFGGVYWKNDKDQRVRRVEASVYDLIEKDFDRFDIVFFFGTIYHLKHPYLALEKIASICDGELYMESAICDDYSPYRGGLEKGYPNNDVVMEFYPGAQYGGNPGNWWVSTLQCLGSMVESVGFKNIHAWGLNAKPTGVPECRGFIYGSKTAADNPNVVKLSAIEDAQFKPPLNVAAVMSVPRLGFMDNLFCVFQAIIPNKIPLIKEQGAFWGQCLERGMQNQIDTDADAILTIDYDTIFTLADAKYLIQLMADHPEADAIVPIQVGRSGMQALVSMKSKSGQLRSMVPKTEFEPELTRITTGHFGLTLIRTSSLLKLPHPWFWGQPGPDGQWNQGRMDDDIYFWNKMEKAGMTVYSANRIVLGHLELVATWPDEELRPIYQPTSEYQEKGKPANCWK